MNRPHAHSRRLVIAILACLLALWGFAGCESSGESSFIVTNQSVPSSPARFSANTRLVVARNGALFRVDPSNLGLTPLTSGFQDSEPDFNSDSNRLVFSRANPDGSGDADIFSVGADGSGLTNLTPGFAAKALDPEYSPDGQQVVFAGETAPGISTLYVMQSDGSGLHEVTGGQVNDRHPSFSPDGTRLVFQRGRGLAEVPTAGGQVTALTDGASVDTQPVFNAAGTGLYFVRGGDVWSLIGGILRQITNTQGDVEFKAIPHPDGATILQLVRSTQGVRAQETTEGGELYSSDLNGGGRQKLTSNLDASDLAVGAARSAPVASTTFTVNIENKSSYSADEVYIQIQGKNEPPQDPARMNDVYWYYLAKADDTSLTPFDRTPETLLKKNLDGSFVGNEKYSIKLSTLRVSDSDPNKNSPTLYTMQVPRENLYSGRIYISFGHPLPGIGINASGYAYKVGDTGNPIGVGSPVTSSANGTGTVDTSDGTVVANLSIDATSAIYTGEPVSGPGVPAGTVVTKVLGTNKIGLNQPLVKGTSVSLDFNATPFDGKALQGPSFTGAPDFMIPWEFMELSATRDPKAADPYYTLFTNTSVVDFYSVGLGMNVDFVDGTTKRVGFVDGSREKILSDFNNLPEAHKGFKGFVMTQIPDNIPADQKRNPLLGQTVPDVKKILRVIGPQNVLQLSANDDPFQSYLAPVIDAAWVTYASTILNITDDLPGHNPYGFTYSGQLIVNGILALTNLTVPDGQGPSGETFRLSKPTTFIVFKCDDTKGGNDSYSNDGSAAHRRLGSLLLAALNRGVLADYQSWSNSKDGKPTFYTLASGLYNHYPEILHRYAIDAKVYGFGYDDIYGQDPTIAGPIGLTQNGVTPPGNPGISQVTVKIPSFEKF